MHSGYGLKRLQRLFILMTYLSILWKIFLWCANTGKDVFILEGPNLSHNAFIWKYQYMYCVNTDIRSQKSENVVCPLLFNSVKHQFVKIGYFFIYDECICLYLLSISLYYIKKIVLKMFCLSRFEWLSATDEKDFCEFSCMRIFHTNKSIQFLKKIIHMLPF